MKKLIDFPLVYQKKQKRGYINAENYLWLNEMEWMTLDEIYNYHYDEGENKEIIPFAFTGGGDKWVWVINSKEPEYSVGLCENGESNGIYYARNMEDAIFRQIIEFVSDSNFYRNVREAKSYQIGERELKKILKQWALCFDGILKEEYLSLIKRLEQMQLKCVKSKYGEWEALLTLNEKNAILDQYIKFEFLDCEFEWYSLE